MEEEVLDSVDHAPRFWLAGPGVSLFFGGGANVQAKQALSLSFTAGAWFGR